MELQDLSGILNSLEIIIKIGLSNYYILNDKYHLDMVIELSWDDFMENKSYNKRMNNYNIS